MYGNPTTTSGGRALKFYSTIRMEVSKVSSSAITEKRGTESVQVGHKMRVKIVKNKPIRNGMVMRFVLANSNIRFLF